MLARSMPWLVVVALVFGAGASAAAQDDDPRVATVCAFVDAHCAVCHGVEEREGGIDLRAMAHAPVLAWRIDGADWRTAVDEVDALRMPPEDAESQPTTEELDAFCDAVESLLGQRAPDQPRDPGRPVLRRLNRTEWQNTVNDLLGVEVDARATLPEDPSGYGFDTVGDVLFVSPMLVEQYWDATAAAVDAFLDRPELWDRFADARVEDGGDPDESEQRTARRLLRAAFRRPPTLDELAGRAALLGRAREAGRPFRDGFRPLLLSALLSPEFLFRVEADRPELGAGVAYRLDAHALAARLSYFLWATMPDAELAARADDGTLTDAQVLRAQTRRMLADPRARSLAEDFAGQWLGFRGLKDVAVDIRRFGAFGRMRGSMYEEAVQTFLAILREDRSVLELIDSDRAWLNEPLAKHYGIEGVAGDEFRAVAVTDRQRGGVLGLGSVLTVTSTPLRTSPVVRGKWILENLLGTPPPPPPPNAGTLPEDDKQDDDLTLRQRLEQHRRDPRCASCHRTMDALGLALESYDGIGRWRTAEHDKPLDTAVELPDGTRLDGVVGLKDWLMGPQRRRVVETATQKLLVYALGRPLDWADGEAVAEIVAAAEEHDFALSRLVEEVVLSYPFRFRRNGVER